VESSHQAEEDSIPDSIEFPESAAELLPTHVAHSTVSSTPSIAEPTESTPLLGRPRSHSDHSTASANGTTNRTTSSDQT
jgi:hypothetical protein